MTVTQADRRGVAWQAWWSAWRRSRSSWSGNPGRGRWTAVWCWEIHDVLAHSLGALGLQIQVAQAVLAERRDQDKVAEILRQAQRMTDDGLTETRRAIQALRGQTLPLPEGLADLSADHEFRHGSPVSFAVTGEPRPLPADTQVAITRTAQEALVNSAKHAQGQPVEIGLDYRGSATTLTVRNHLGDCTASGTTFATADGGYGLAGMRERLLLLDGTLAAGPDGNEWAVIATVPSERESQ